MKKSYSHLKIKLKSKIYKIIEGFNSISMKSSMYKLKSVLMDTTDPDITFNSKGQCHHCNHI